MLRNLSLGGEARPLILLPAPGDTGPRWPDSQHWETTSGHAPYIQMNLAALTSPGKVCLRAE